MTRKENPVPSSKDVANILPCVSCPSASDCTCYSAKSNISLPPPRTSQRPLVRESKSRGAAGTERLGTVENALLASAEEHI